MARIMEELNMSGENAHERGRGKQKKRWKGGELQKKKMFEWDQQVRE